MRVGDKTRVAVCFDEETAFDVRDEVEGGQGCGDGGGVLAVAVIGGWMVDGFYLGERDVHFVLT